MHSVSPSLRRSSSAIRSSIRLLQPFDSRAHSLRDGTRSGYDCELLRAVGDAVGVPVIASGGVGTLEHLYEGIADGGASAVLAASIFHFGEHSVRDAKEYLAARGVVVRP